MKSFDQLSQFLKQYDDSTSPALNKKRPPVDTWHPTEYLEMDILIKSNGDWWHEGHKMTRSKLVSLFASILVVETVDNDTNYYLKTPVQKVKIHVEDAPLFINDVAIIPLSENKNTPYWLEFHTTTGDVIRLDEQHVPYFDKSKASNIDEARPYVFVRDGLHALIGRSVYYHLMELGELVEQEGQTLIRLHSGGQAFDMLYPD